VHDRDRERDKISTRDKHEEKNDHDDRGAREKEHHRERGGDHYKDSSRKERGEKRERSLPRPKPRWNPKTSEPHSHEKKRSHDRHHRGSRSRGKSSSEAEEMSQRSRSSGSSSESSSSSTTSTAAEEKFPIDGHPAYHPAKKLRKIEPTISIDEYFCRGFGWDIDALVEDLKLILDRRKEKSKTASKTAPSSVLHDTFKENDIGPSLQKDSPVISPAPTGVKALPPLAPRFPPNAKRPCPPPPSPRPLLSHEVCAPDPSVPASKTAQVQLQQHPVPEPVVSSKQPPQSLHSYHHPLASSSHGTKAGQSNNSSQNNMPDSNSNRNSLPCMFPVRPPPPPPVPASTMPPPPPPTNLVMVPMRPPPPPAPSAPPPPASHLMPLPRPPVPQRPGMSGMEAPVWINRPMMMQQQQQQQYQPRPTPRMPWPKLSDPACMKASVPARPPSSATFQASSASSTSVPVLAPKSPQPSSSSHVNTNQHHHQGGPPGHDPSSPSTSPSNVSPTPSEPRNDGGSDANELLRAPVMSKALGPKRPPGSPHAPQAAGRDKDFRNEKKERKERKKRKVRNDENDARSGSKASPVVVEDSGGEKEQEQPSSASLSVITEASRASPPALADAHADAQEDHAADATDEAQEKKAPLTSKSITSKAAGASASKSCSGETPQMNILCSKARGSAPSMTAPSKTSIPSKNIHAVSKSTPTSSVGVAPPSPGLPPPSPSQAKSPCPSPEIEVWEISDEEDEAAPTDHPTLYAMGLVAKAPSMSGPQKVDTLEEEQAQWEQKLRYDPAEGACLISMSNMNLSEDNIMSYLMWLQHKLENMQLFDPLLNIDLSQNRLEHRCVGSLLTMLQNINARCHMLNLSGNKVNDEAIKMLTKFLTSYNEASVLELHLSRNEITRNGVMWLLVCLAFHPAYPVRDAQGTYCPMWLCLDHNSFSSEDAAELLSRAYECLAISFCDSVGCTTSVCHKSYLGSKQKPNCVAHMVNFFDQEGSPALFPLELQNAKSHGHMIFYNFPTLDNLELIRTKRQEPAIVWEDDHNIVVMKPANWLCHSTHRRARNLNELLEQKDVPSLHHYLELRYPNAPSVHDRNCQNGLCHRLDRETSGFVLCCKTKKGYDNIKQQIYKHELIKDYIALVHGRMEDQNGMCKARIDDSGYKNSHLNGQRGGKVQVTENPNQGVEAITLYETLKHYEGKDGKPYTLCHFRLVTGRTHQIRVHMNYMGHPLVSDTLYCENEIILREDLEHCPRLWLHKLRAAFYNADNVPQVVWAPLFMVPDLCKTLLNLTECSP